jgi:hypothetical protein
VQYDTHYCVYATLPLAPFRAIPHQIYLLNDGLLLYAYTKSVVLLDAVGNYKYKQGLLFNDIKVFPKSNKFIVRSKKKMRVFDSHWHKFTTFRYRDDICIADDDKLYTITVSSNICISNYDSPILSDDDFSGFEGFDIDYTGTFIFVFRDIIVCVPTWNY